MIKFIFFFFVVVLSLLVQQNQARRGVVGGAKVLNAMLDQRLRNLIWRVHCLHCGQRKRAHMKNAIGGERKRSLPNIPSNMRARNPRLVGWTSHPKRLHHCNAILLE